VKFEPLCVPRIEFSWPKCLAVGNPVEVATGDKVERVIDYSIPGTRQFSVTRTYRSSLSSKGKRDLGFGWTFDHESELWRGFDRSTVYLSLDDGVAAIFNAVGETVNQT